MKRTALKRVLSLILTLVFAASLLSTAVFAAGQGDGAEGPDIVISGAPANSGEGGEPGEPVNPGEGGEPGAPVNPGEGGEPGAPVNPGEGGEPGEPANPGEGGEPGEPVNPEEGVNPGETGQSNGEWKPLEAVNPETGALEDVMAAIGELTPAKDVSLDDADSIHSARSMYESLSTDEKPLVTNIHLLEAAEAALEDLEFLEQVGPEAADVILKIRLIREPEDILTNGFSDDTSDGTKGKIAAAKLAYSALTEDQKQLIPGELLQKLSDAEIAVTVNRVRTRLPDADQVTLSDEGEIWLAWHAYADLTDGQKDTIQESYPDAAEKLTAVVAALRALTGYGYAAIEGAADTAKYDTVRAAIAAAKDGDTILISGRVPWGGNSESGWPEGSITIQNAKFNEFEYDAVVLHGADGENDPTPVLTVLGCAVTMKDLTLERSSSKQFIFACGNRLEICEDVVLQWGDNYASGNTGAGVLVVIGGSYKEDVESTELVLKGCVYGTVIGGGIGYDVTGDTNVYIGGSALAAGGESGDRIYGGGLLGSVGGSTHLTIDTPVGALVYGGGFKCDVGGDTNVAVHASCGNIVYGGSGIGRIAGNTSVVIDAGVQVSGSLYGGCKSTGAEFPWGSYSQTGNNYNPAFTIGIDYAGKDVTAEDLKRTGVAGNTSVLLNGVCDGSVYGGGEGAGVGGNTEVIISGTACAKPFTFRRVCGGGSSGDVGGNTYVEITETGAVMRGLSGKSTQSGNVYGGGSGCVVRGNTKVVVSGQVGNEDLGGLVYGGGYGGSSDVLGTAEVVVNRRVPTGTNTEVIGWDIYENYDFGLMSGVYGGGWNNVMSGNSRIEINADVGDMPIYGGSLIGNVAGNTEVVLNSGAKADRVVAGGRPVCPGGYQEAGEVGGAASVTLRDNAQVKEIWGYEPLGGAAAEDGGARSVAEKTAVLFDGNTGRVAQVRNADQVTVTNRSDVTIDSDGTDYAQLVNVGDLTIDNGGKLTLPASAHILGGYAGGAEAPQTGTLRVASGKKLIANGAASGVTALEIDESAAPAALHQVYVAAMGGSAAGSFTYTDAQGRFDLENNKTLLSQDNANLTEEELLELTAAAGEGADKWWLVKGEKKPPVNPPVNPGTPDPDPDPPKKPDPTPVPPPDRTPDPQPEDEVTIDDTDTPLGGLPEVGDEDTVVIVDEDTPLGNLPQTGTQPAPARPVGAAAAAAMAVSLAAAGLALGLRKKEQN